MTDSESDSKSTSSDIHSDSDLADESNCDQPVAPPSAGASMEHYQELQQRNAMLNENNNVLNAQQLKCPSTASASSKTSDIKKLILSVAKKYSITTEMFLPDKVIFQTNCPDPPAEILNPNHYAKKSTEKDTLFGTGMQQARSSFINGLCSVAGTILNMPNEYFMSKFDHNFVPQVTRLIRWETGKGKVYDVFKAPILYPDHVINEKKVFRNWLVFAMTIFVLSPDQKFLGDGVGAISSITTFVDKVQIRGHGIHSKLLKQGLRLPPAHMSVPIRLLWFLHHC
ncbi:uncharacterized protein F5891DRAFT_986156 [Suillus fuscotomentosus]|uniref:Uncharacterized protein n=1 Tax=Suillus fuscotomentosus TaxID=1912939 RepID=A0AAD4DSK5_9AGAM|nr:uncharacterized protein F5891DRAFT_986156 [Suillus fuscotomentosus]KAG1893166.1 hypothetical protein F5891DRAFT_986156 [Suillus fuscotomentosus]